jgi:hypothetical protein
LGHSEVIHFEGCGHLTVNRRNPNCRWPGPQCQSLLTAAWKRGAAMPWSIAEEYSGLTLLTEYADEVYRDSL